MNQKAPLAYGLASLLSTHAAHSASIFGALKVRFGFCRGAEEPEAFPLHKGAQACSAPMLALHGQALGALKIHLGFFPVAR